jgi:hypothetical protein
MKAHWFCGLTEDPGKMTWAAANEKIRAWSEERRQRRKNDMGCGQSFVLFCFVLFFFLFFGEEKGDGKYQTWCLKEDWVRKGLTVAERRDNIGLKEWRKFAYVRRRDDSGFGDINREQKRKQ